jgi:subtilisin family serine protease
MSPPQAIRNVARLARSVSSLVLVWLAISSLAFGGSLPECKPGEDVSIIVGLYMDPGFERLPLNSQSRLQDREIEVAAVQDGFLLDVGGAGFHRVHRFRYIPYLSIEAECESISTVRNHRRVSSVALNSVNVPTLSTSASTIGADWMWDSGYDGDGSVVVVIDTGVDHSHPALGNRLETAHEACFGTTQGNVYATPCLLPDSDGNEIGPGTAERHPGCDGGNCEHGTHVTGIVAANPADGSVLGIAHGSRVVALQVCSLREYNYLDPTKFMIGGCFEEDLIDALEHVLGTVRYYYEIVAINISNGSAQFYDDPYDCWLSHLALREVIRDLSEVGIPVIASSGSENHDDALSSPACLGNVFSVGATDDSDTVIAGSASASFLDLLAPGQAIESTVPTALDADGYAELTGTSMAAPHVTGAVALLRQAFPYQASSVILDHLRSTGKGVVDPRNGRVKPRIDLPAALHSLSEAITWVDFSYLGVELGTYPQPLNTFSEALSHVGTGGEIHIKGDTSVSSTAGAYTVDFPCTIRANGGTVTIGG